jgi:hypothetical protein
MRRSNVQNIGDVVKDLMKELHIDQKLLEVRIINSWGEILGANIQRATNKIFVKNRVLFVYLKSPIVRNELMMMKSNIIKRLNEQVGEKVIDDLVLR